jgi:hypothetical protein
MKIRSLVVSFALVLISVSALAQTPDGDAQIKFLKEQANKQSERIADLAKKVEGLEAPLWKKYVETKQQEYEFQADMMAVNTRNFWHQSVASYVILLLVVGVVTAGVWFAYIQLAAGLGAATSAAAASSAAAVAAAAAVGAPVAGAQPAQTNPPAAGVASPPKAASDFGTNVTIKADQVTIATSVVGLVVLIISLAFLYIYTDKIYQIRVVDPYRPVVNDPDHRTEATRTAADKPGPKPAAPPTPAPAAPAH